LWNTAIEQFRRVAGSRPIANKIPETGRADMERQTPDWQIGQPRLAPKAPILQFAIACCAFTMAIVLAVAMMASQ
jgi:hypothetical protein